LQECGYQNRLETAFNEARQEIEELKKLASATGSEKMETLIKEVQKYRELSLADHLTGLFNKRYLQTRLVEEVTRAKRSSYYDDSRKSCFSGKIFDWRKTSQSTFSAAIRDCDMGSPCSSHDELRRC